MFKSGLGLKKDEIDSNHSINDRNKKNLITQKEIEKLKKQIKEQKNKTNLIAKEYETKFEEQQSIIAETLKESKN